MSENALALHGFLSSCSKLMEMHSIFTIYSRFCINSVGKTITWLLDKSLVCVKTSLICSFFYIPSFQLSLQEVVVVVEDEVASAVTEAVVEDVEALEEIEEVSKELLLVEVSLLTNFCSTHRQRTWRLRR